MKPTLDWDSPEIADLVRRALAEDIGSGDLTSEALIPEDAAAQARIVAREELVVAGLPLVDRVFRALDPAARVEGFFPEGAAAPAGVELARVAARARAILSGERVALNFLARLAGIATLTRRFTARLAGAHTRIRDTRKTTPLLRALEKYAVRMGGGENHRFGLYDAILIKENHIAAAGGIAPALERARAAAGVPVQIEVRDETELRQALAAGAESVLLDNVSPETAAALVNVARMARPGVVVELSGGVTLDNIRDYAAAGADFISVGALTHSPPAADLSLLVLPPDAR